MIFFTPIEINDIKAAIPTPPSPIRHVLVLTDGAISLITRPAPVGIAQPKRTACLKSSIAGFNTNLFSEMIE